MVSQDRPPEQIEKEIALLAESRARDRARNAKWDLNIAIFLFAILILILILLFQQVATEIVAPIAVFGLAMVWLVGWRRGRQLFKLFYKEELARAKMELEARKKDMKEALQETIEDQVQKAFREREIGR